jgi:hypothetical protein
MELRAWQKEIRDSHLEEDLKANNINNYEDLRIGDFIFAYVDKHNLDEVKKVKEFIERYEWLGSIGQYPTHRFTVSYNDILSGALIMGVPAAFSTLLGEGTKRIERLISRGACSSFTPKNLASYLIMSSIKWMVHNTRFRLFVAYADPEAGELGTVYQACNFYYLGKSSGASYKCFDPVHPEWGWFSDRRFRTRASYKIYAKDLGISWGDDWVIKGKLVRDNIPPEILKLLVDESKKSQKRSIKTLQKQKHKYAYVLGASKKETKQLRKKFEELNYSIILDYPKVRGC